ncbi:hypothetical protein FHS10_000070 [Mucilaginibacter dorajii]|nr:hypothetical protein [Mucilaginibacter dorajii]
MVKPTIVKTTSTKSIFKTEPDVPQMLKKLTLWLK